MSEFRYRRLIEIKQKLLETKQLEMEGATSSLREINGKIDAVKVDVDTTYRNITEECITGSQFAVLKDYLAYLDQRLAALGEERKKREALLEELRKELMALNIELKMLGKMRTKAKQRIRKSDNMKEQKIMDEIALRIGSH
jgi:flagellar export protein FliJ